MLTECYYVTARHHTAASEGEKTTYQEAIECLYVVHEGEETGSDQGVYTKGECCY